MPFYRKGYRIKVLDTVDLENSMHFNPFAYIRTPKDILTLANTLFTNLKPPDSGTPPDPFFDQAALLWLQAAIGLLWYEAPLEEQTIPSLLEILEADEVREDDETYENAVDLLFKDLEKKNPRHFAVKQRKKYKKAAGYATFMLGYSGTPLPEIESRFCRQGLHRHPQEEENNILK